MGLTCRSSASRRTWRRASTWPSTSSCGRRSPSPNSTASRPRRSPDCGPRGIAPESLAYRGLISALYGDRHPYRIPVDGESATVEAISRDDARRFHRTFYRPDRAAVVVAGDVDEDRLKDLLEARLGSWKEARPAASRDPRPAAAPSPPDPDRSPRRPAGRRSRGACGHPSAGRGSRPAHAVQPDPRRAVHLAIELEAARGEGVYLRNPQPFRHEARAGSVLDLGLAPVRPPGRGAPRTSATRSANC